MNAMRPLRVVEVLAICGCKRRGESCRFKLQEVGVKMIGNDIAYTETVVGRSKFTWFQN
jgi:hypothetical protein